LRGQAFLQQEASMSLASKVKRGEFKSLRPRFLIREDHQTHGIKTQVIIISGRGNEGSKVAHDTEEDKKYLEALEKNNGWREIRRKMADLKVHWVLTPTKGQHHNGDVERLIQETKRLYFQKNSCRRTVGDVQTILQEVASILNSRPIWRRLNINPIDGGALTPNQLLIGRSQIENRGMLLDEDVQGTKTSKRIAVNENLVTE